MYKRIIILTGVLYLFYNTCSAQKLYIWCPKEQEVKQRMGFLKNEEVNVVVFDGRTIPTNSKVECNSVDVSHAITSYIQQTYPSPKIKILSDSNYYDKSEKGKITIKIAIAAYQAGFGTDVTIGIGSVGGKFSYGLVASGEWNGLTTYYVQIFDNRGREEKKYHLEINEVSSKPNIWGYKTAKSCLEVSYEKANQDLLYFIENTFVE